MNIHERITEQTNLARIYAEDGAFHTAGRIFRALADEVTAHALACDKALIAQKPTIVTSDHRKRRK